MRGDCREGGVLVAGQLPGEDVTCGLSEALHQTGDGLLMPRPPQYCLSAMLLRVGAGGICQYVLQRDNAKRV